MNKFLTTLCIGAVAVAAVGVANAGNVPQYKLTQKVEKQSETEKVFKYLDGAVSVPVNWGSDNTIFADGVSVTEARNGKGFEIGFPFRFAGRTFTHFAICNQGVLYLSEGEEVVFRGMNNMIFQRNNIPMFASASNEFYLGVNFKAVETEASAYEGGKISYKTSGEEGDRTLTVEYKNIRLEGQIVDDYIGIFDLQIVLHEKDGVVDYVINEVNSPYDSNLYFVPGMRGWDKDDQFILTAKSLGKTARISDQKFFDLLEKDTKVIWDGQYDYDQYYCTTYTLTPDLNTVAPTDAPKNVEVSQEGKNLVVKFEKGANADATIVLVSPTAFTAENLPVDGLTYGVTNNLGEYAFEIGDAKVIYYGNESNPKIEYPGIKNGEEYKVAVISCNGYPAYNRENAVFVDASTPQAGPSSLSAASENAEEIKLSWTSGDPVIVAATLECDRTVIEDFAGVFGKPSGDAKVGDEIAGGGKVVYVGDAHEAVVKALENNKMHYFAAWTVKDGRISATYAKAHGLTTPSIPYEPAFETYPGWITPSSIESTTATPSYIGIVNRGNDDEPAFRIVLVNDGTTQFSLPAIEYQASQDLTLDFEFAMETDRGFSTVGSESGPSVQIPLGNEAGHFDSGALEVLCNNNVVKTIKEYNGTMTSNGDEGWFSGTSTFDPVTVTIPMNSENRYRVGFRARAEKTSNIYMRNIKIYEGGSHVGTITEAGKDVVAISMPGMIRFIASADAKVEVYSLDGKRVATMMLKAGEEKDINVAAGVYVANGSKLMVK